MKIGKKYILVTGAGATIWLWLRRTLDRQNMGCIFFSCNETLSLIVILIKQPI